MIAFLILFLALVIFLAFFIGNNLTFSCPFWLFKGYDSVSVLILIFAAFAAGIIFSIIVMLAGKYAKNKSEAVMIKEEKSKKELKEEKRIRKLEAKNKKAKKTEDIKVQQ